MSEQQKQPPKLIQIQVTVTDQRLTGTEKAQQTQSVTIPAEYVDTGQAAQIANAIAFVSLGLSEMFNQKLIAAHDALPPPPQQQ
jgi:hypothetical protein